MTFYSNDKKKFKILEHNPEIGQNIKKMYCQMQE